MDFSLKGKVAIVTGASRGIGLAIARAYADAGATVVITARKIEGLNAATEGYEGRLIPIVAHAGRAEAAYKTVDEVVSRFGRLDILVNNAATNPYMGPMIDVEGAAFDKTFEINLKGPLTWTQAAWRAWMKDHGGSILNVSSIGGRSPGGAIGVYDMTKAGLMFMTEHFASELAPKVRVNALAPGLVKTDFARALWASAPADTKWPWPLQRLGEPEDIASGAVFLVSDAASWVTGVVLTIDGGALVAPGAV